MSSHQTSSNLRPRDRLLLAAEAWSAATGRSLGALSSIVANHGSALERLRDEGNAVTDAQLAKFARFLGDAANWPEGAEIPEEVRAFVHVMGCCLTDSRPEQSGATGQGGEASGVPVPSPSPVPAREQAA